MIVRDGVRERSGGGRKKGTGFYLASEQRRVVGFVLSSSLFIDLTRQDNQDEILFKKNGPRWSEEQSWGKKEEKRLLQ